MALCFAKCLSNTGNKIRLVNALVISVNEVSQPNAFVPPKLLMQKMIKPATSTNEVYTMLMPVW